MSFIRNIAAANDMQRALTPGIAQPVVVAWGDDEDTAKYHGAQQGMQEVDFGHGGQDDSDDSLVSGASAHEVFFTLALFFTLNIA